MRGYGEAEFLFSIIKVIAVIGYIILGIILNCGGGADEGYVGGRYWRDPGAFHNGFKGMHHMRFLSSRRDKLTGHRLMQRLCDRGICFWRN